MGSLSMNIYWKLTAATKILTFSSVCSRLVHFQDAMVQ